MDTKTYGKKTFPLSMGQWLLGSLLQYPIRAITPPSYATKGCEPGEVGLQAEYQTGCKKLQNYEGSCIRVVGDRICVPKSSCYTYTSNPTKFMPASIYYIDSQTGPPDKDEMKISRMRTFHGRHEDASKPQLGNADPSKHSHPSFPSTRGQDTLTIGLLSQWNSPISVSQSPMGRIFPICHRTCQGILRQKKISRTVPSYSS